MTRDEARAVLEAAAQADGGSCESCTSEVVGVLQRLLPDVPWAEIALAQDPEPKGFDREQWQRIVS